MMSHWPRRLLALAVVGVLACDDQSVAPAGAFSSASIRAYVDADGSGGFAAGDPAIAGAVVVLTRADGTVLNAETDAEGLVVFAALPAGTWVATLQGTPPAGAVLGTASRLTLEAPFQGGTLTGEFRFVYQPGSVVGVVFRDDDGNGVWTPGVDFAGAGMDVALFAGTDTTADPVDQTVSDAGGLFSFTGLRPGQYTVRIAPPFVTMDITGGPLRTVDVPPAGAADLAVQFTGTAIQPIADAKAADSGSVVTVEGVISVAQGTFRTQGDNIYMQDESSGIQVFNLDPSLGLAVGDSIRVTAVRSNFSTELQLIRLTQGVPLTVTDLGAGATPVPRLISAADMVARTYEGELATITDAVLDSVQTGTSAAYNLWFTAPPGTTIQARIEAGVGATVLRAGWVVGDTYSLTGVLGSFNAVAQIKPRGASDIASGAPPTLTIADAKLQPQNDTVRVVGVVTVGQFTFRTQGDNLYLQDATSGIQVFDADSALHLVPGDSVRVTGRMGQFNGELQLVRLDPVTAGARLVVTDLGTGTAVTPRDVTVTELNARTYEGELTRITDAVLPTVPTGTSAAYNLTFNVGGTNFTVRIEAGVGATVTRASWTAGGTYTLTGVLGSFNAAAQLKPRGAADIVLQP